MIWPFLIFCTIISTHSEPKICDGNRFKHISSYALGKQNDLTLTFGILQPTIKVDKVIYQDQIFRTFTIFPLNLSLSYLESKQTAQSQGVDRVRITGGTLKINYNFTWEKKQLSSSINGTGKGVVTTDAVTFIKSLDINAETKHLEWNFVSANPITITNSLTITEFKPYKLADYDTVNEMFNHLKSGGTTVKDNLLKALNLNFTQVLKKVVHENQDTWKQPSFIEYSYSDYRGDFTVGYDNFMLNLSLLNGLDLLITETIQNDSGFECGEKVPDVPDDERIFGGLQEFISNKFLKSTLRYALRRGQLDVVLTEQFWQSPAFQFFMGDLHEVIPATKNISTLEPITGRCKALDDKFFAFEKKSADSYNVSVNFTCDLNFNKTRIMDINLAVNYELKVLLKSNSLDFIVRSIVGVPSFIEQQAYKIKNMDLAQFMVEQTLKMAQSSTVLGSGFKTMTRKFPGLQVRDTYLFLYDSSSKIHSQQ